MVNWLVGNMASEPGPQNSSNKIMELGGNAVALGVALAIFVNAAPAFVPWSMTYLVN